jgi:hypothetical protein
MSISGTVTVAAGGTADNICVGAEGPNGAENFYNVMTSPTDGTYSLTGLPAGNYFVTFYDGPPCSNNTPNYADNFYDASVPGGTLNGNDAGEVNVSTVDATGINAVMQPGGAIGGTVTSAITGHPLAGVCVEVTWTNGGTDEEFATTNGSGVYGFSGLDPQNGAANVNAALDYTVTVSPSPYCSNLDAAQYVSQSYPVPMASLSLGFNVTAPAFSVTSAEVPPVTVTSSDNPAPTNASVTYHATLGALTWPNDASSLPQNPPAPAPGGKVSFSDNGTPIAACSGANAVAVSGSTAACTVSYASGATHAITANYTGDDNYGPSSGNLSQTVIAGATPVASYDLVGSDGGVFVFGQGGAGFYGSLPGIGVHVNNIKGIVPTADHKGYFLVGSDGGVFAFGDAPFENSLPGIGVHVNDIVGIVPTSNDAGYFLVGSDGGVFTFGNAPFENSLPGIGVHVNNIVGIVPTANNTGYWLVSSTGTVYAFGNATAYGSVNSPSAPVVGIAATSDGGGYWVVSADGTVYPFGDAIGHGTLPALGVHVSNIVSLVPTADNGGYWLIGNDGGVFAFGDAPFGSSLPAIGVHVSNVVGAVPVG